MSIADHFSSSFQVIRCDIGEKSESIYELNKWFNISLPIDYVQLLQQMSEIEINCSNKYIRIWNVQGCIEMNTAYDIQKYIPDSMAIGDDGYCNVFIYANGSNGFGLYILPLDDIEFDGLIFLAPSISDFFCKNIGVEKFSNVW